jgi:Transposase domain (DUF772)
VLHVYDHLQTPSSVDDGLIRHTILVSSQCSVGSKLSSLLIDGASRHITATSRRCTSWRKASSRTGTEYLRHIQFVARAYHPATLLKIYIYGYLNRIQSSRRLKREAQRNVELVWLTGKLMPDFKTIADFRKDNGAAIRRVCAEFVVRAGR